MDLTITYVQSTTYPAIDFCSNVNSRATEKDPLIFILICCRLYSQKETQDDSYCKMTL